MSININQLEQEMALELMPDVVADISELIGYPKTCRLIESFGGLDFRMPKSSNGQWAETLIEVLGNDDAQRLMNVYGGTRLYIPRCNALMIYLRNHDFVSKVEQAVADGSSQTLAIQKYALQYGFSERWAYEVLKATRCELHNQMGLF